MTDALCRTIMHLTDERDALAVELAALKVHQHDTSKSLAKSAIATADAQQERDEALDTISRVWAVILSSNAALVVDRVRKALEPAQASPQEAAGATGAPEGTRGGRDATEPAASLTGTSDPTKGATK